MIGFIKSLFSATPSGVVGKVMDAGDALVLTNEEKMQLFIEYQKATLPQNLARRFLALMVVGTYLIMVIMSAATWYWFKDFSEFLFNLATESLAIPVTTIIGFYFLKRFTMGGDK